MLDVKCGRHVLFARFERYQRHIKTVDVELRYKGINVRYPFSVLILATGISVKSNIQSLQAMGMVLICFVGGTAVEHRLILLIFTSFKEEEQTGQDDFRKRKKKIEESMGSIDVRWNSADHSYRGLRSNAPVCLPPTFDRTLAIFS